MTMSFGGSYNHAEITEDFHATAGLLDDVPTDAGVPRERRGGEENAGREQWADGSRGQSR